MTAWCDAARRGVHYFHHPKVDDFPTTACLKVPYFSFTVAPCQCWDSVYLFIYDTSFFLFIFTFHPEPHRWKKNLLLSVVYSPSSSVFLSPEVPNATNNLFSSRILERNRTVLHPEDFPLPDAFMIEFHHWLVQITIRDYQSLVSKPLLSSQTTSSCWQFLLTPSVHKFSYKIREHRLRPCISHLIL